MKLGSAGEAFFVTKCDGEPQVDKNELSSPIPSNASDKSESPPEKAITIDIEERKDCINGSLDEEEHYDDTPVDLKMLKSSPKALMKII